jgi:hypothetical protein
MDEQAGRTRTQYEKTEGSHDTEEMMVLQGCLMQQELDILIHFFSGKKPNEQRKQSRWL